MTERIVQQQAFLKNLVLLKTPKAKRELLKANAEQVKAVVEVILNCKYLLNSIKRKGVNRKLSSLSKYFKRRKILKTKLLLKYLNKNFVLLKLVLATFLEGILEMAVICALTT